MPPHAAAARREETPAGPQGIRPRAAASHRRPAYGQADAAQSPEQRRHLHPRSRQRHPIGRNDAGPPGRDHGARYRHRHCGRRSGSHHGALPDRREPAVPLLPGHRPRAAAGTLAHRIARRQLDAPQRNRRRHRRHSHVSGDAHGLSSATNCWRRRRRLAMLHRQAIDHLRESPMPAKSKFDKSKLPSRYVSVGPASAPHRSYYYAMGMTEAEIAQPFVGVATTWNEAAPCNIALGRQAQAVKKGVKAAGGTPREFTTITVTDGIAMGHAGMKSSLISREIIADSVELTMRGHCYDALVGLAGCDKSLPGLMMAMLRLNVPSVFMYGGSIMPGRFRGRDVTVQDVFEAVGAHSAGKMSEKDLHALEAVACPSSGSCGGQFTANTMACVSEAIGLALPGSAGAPAPYDSRDAFAEQSGEAVMRLIEHNLRPRDIVTRRSLENAAMVVAASGGSTNAGLHLPAMAHEAGIEFDLHDVCAIFKRTPYIADL